MAITAEEAMKMNKEEIQEAITEIAFEMIAKVGSARGFYIEAIQLAKTGEFEAARQLVEDGKAIFVEGHHAHADILTMYSSGVEIPMNIFLMHAEDQMLTAEAFETIALEMIAVYERLENK